MVTLTRIHHTLDPNAYWSLPIKDHEQPSVDWMESFDQNGYDLTPLEELYAVANNSPVYNMRWRRAIYKQWYTCPAFECVHINHACLFERKGYKGAALEQIRTFAEQVPIIYKLIHMKPKWGIDISIDYVDEDKAFEVFHYEWDDFDYNAVIDKQNEIEQLVDSSDWQWLGKVFWDKRDQWMHLDFDGQTKFKTDYLGISPERFKLVAWTL